MSDRRHFLQSTLLASLGLANLNFKTNDSKAKALKPAALKSGDTIGLVCPAYSAFIREDVQIAIESLEAFGFKVKKGEHIFDRYGYLAGTDADRAADINKMFADTTINGIMAMHGGWGCARILPLLDYKTIQKNPKVFIGYSDITPFCWAFTARQASLLFTGR